MKPYRRAEVSFGINLVCVFIGRIEKERGTQKETEKDRNREIEREVCKFPAESSFIGCITIEETESNK